MRSRCFLNGLAAMDAVGINGCRRHLRHGDGFGIDEVLYVMILSIDAFVALVGGNVLASGHRCLSVQEDFNWGRVPCVADIREQSRQPNGLLSGMK